MKIVYPVILTPIKDGYMAYCPDIEFNTHGADIPDAIAMARDALGLTGIAMQDQNKPFPKATPIEKITRKKNEIVTLVDSNLAEYRRANEQRAVRRNVSLPSWLDHEADKAGINVSAVLQEALKSKLGAEDIRFTHCPE